MEILFKKDLPLLNFGAFTTKQPNHSMTMTFTDFFAAIGVTVEAGTKTKGFLPVPGTPVEMPYTIISGTRPGKQILITGGVHGGEYPCIETAIQLGLQLQPSEISGVVVVIHPVNPPAFHAKLQYYGPYDGKNLNRVFPGKAMGSVSERIAYTVSQLQQCSDFFIDLHGGDIHEALLPFVIYSKLGGESVAAQSREVSSFLGFPYVVGSVSDNGSIGGAAVSGVPGLLAELGMCGRWSPEEVEEYIEAVRNTLRGLGVLEGTFVRHEDVKYLESMQVVTAGHKGCWYPSRELGDEVGAGEKLGEIRDFFGEVLSTYYADRGGILLYVVTSLAIVEGDPLCAVGA